MNKLERIKQLIKELNNASYAYYNQIPIMPDYEWDKMYDELISLEKRLILYYLTVRHITLVIQLQMN